MKLSELIKQLQEFEKKEGDIDVRRSEWDMHLMSIYYVNVEQTDLDIDKSGNKFIAIE